MNRLPVSVPLARAGRAMFTGRWAAKVEACAKVMGSQMLNRSCRLVRDTSCSRCLSTMPARSAGGSLSQLSFEQLYQLRSNLEMLIQDYAKREIPRITYEFLTEYVPPLSDNERFMLSIKVLNMLLTYTCRRLLALQRLPYIAVINPNIEESNRLYLKTLESLLAIELPYGLHDHAAMREKLITFLDDHGDTLVTLSKGFEEIMDFYPQQKVFDFLNIHLRDRLSMKLLVTHYLRLVEQSSGADCIGVLDKRLNIAELVKRTEEFVGDLTFVKYDRIVPVNILEGHDVTFACIPQDLEYVLQEILKNSARAHIENHTPSNYSAEKPIEVTIVRSYEDLEIRIRDFGGGIPPDVEDRMFDYSYTTSEKDAKDTGMSAYIIPGQDVSNVSGMGFGLPLCKAYVEMFNGELDIVSLWGWGTDVYIRLKGPKESLLDRVK
ncbi:ADL116Cp [Eremothecium gossypii ATCC 10895]|uniref:Protein-serine/threonine kinase n=1 Tax=Eremothecium gossypii (strain ATCC 10895 / CBS 109.51 / FGSC 9923 / NRRL Y-1056) TaxID=284811 RepID=Q75AN8_EREGS|nr:ADL116Cp [Eremothecium gossypii ATCC 10895]AAS51804.1 ADL116Cp [Eremothecium gossypii ATCC 10895]AEY96102.1 FADL116Cp [Eremothecium gossypii FDAG1]